MHGIIVVDKEKGMTSRDVVNELSHIFKTRKVGHTGTLDPLATGVLVITLGKYTKLNEILTSTYKEYIATMKLGISTDTYDIEGKVIDKKEVNLNKKEIINVINSFKGKYIQEVPIYSSVKVNGKKLYEYARKNESVILPKREVDIKEIEVLSIQNDIVKFRVLVSKGTYIRSLINDIGVKFKCGAAMTNLRRTKQGIFNVENSYKLDDIKKGNFEFENALEVLNLPIFEIDEYLYDKIKNGSILENRYNEDAILFTKDYEPVAIYKKYVKDNTKIKPWKMF